MRYTYVRQHDTTDCAAACLAMVCLHYKKEITITRLRDMMGTDLKGTNLTGMEKAAQELLRLAFEKMKLNARSYDRIIKVAQTIADLAEKKTIGYEHIAEAVQLRLSVAEK